MEQKQTLAEIARKKRYRHLVMKLQKSNSLSLKEIAELERYEDENLVEAEAEEAHAEPIKRSKKTGRITGKMAPLFKPGQSGNPKGRPKGTVRRWDAVMREFFKLAENEPEQLVNLTGLKLPEKIQGKDGQMLLIMNQVIRALKGDQRAVENLMDRMDGKPKEIIDMTEQNGINLNDLPSNLRQEVLEELLKKEKK